MHGIFGVSAISAARTGYLSRDWGACEAESTYASPESMPGFTQITQGEKSYVVRMRIDLLAAFINLAYFDLNLQPREDVGGGKILYNVCSKLDR